MIVADSDVLIDFLRGSAQADRIELELKTGGLATTVISAFELWSGARSSRQSATVEVLLSALTIVPLTPASAREAAKVRIDLDKKKIPIGMADSLIAGICLAERAVLLTRNKKHFERVSGLRLASSPS